MNEKVYLVRSSEESTLGIFTDLEKAWEKVKKYADAYIIMDQHNKQKMTFELFESTIKEHDGIKMIVSWFFIYVDPYTLNE